MSDKEVALKIEHFHDDEDIQFHIKSKMEMLSILQGIADQGAHVALFYGNDQNFILTTLLEVNEQGMWLDASQFPPEDEQLLLGDKITFVSMHQQVKIQFVAQDIDRDRFESNEAFYLELPGHLLRILRREFFRTAIPAAASVKCIIPIPPKNSNGRIVMREIPVMDISGDGLGLLCEEHDDVFVPDRIFRDCRISIPDAGILKVTIVVRNGMNFTAPDNVVYTRVGCRFILLDNKMNILLQRYIIRLQGENQRAQALSLREDDDAP